MPELPRRFEDLVAGTVYELGSAPVEHDEIVSFARRFDPQPMHVADAVDTPYGGLIASGWHTAALTMRLLVEGFLQGSENLGSPGVEELCWLVPVRPGDVLHARATVLTTRRSASRAGVGVARVEVETRNQHEQLVMRMTSVGLFAAGT